jgi:hypothetical protein
MRDGLQFFIRLRQNTLQLVAGMNGETNHGEARQSEDWLATPQFRLIPRSLWKIPVYRGCGELYLESPVRILLPKVKLSAGSREPRDLAAPLLWRLTLKLNLLVKGAPRTQVSAFRLAPSRRKWSHLNIVRPTMASQGRHNLKSDRSAPA